MIDVGTTSKHIAATHLHYTSREKLTDGQKRVLV